MVFHQDHFLTIQSCWGILYTTCWSKTFSYPKAPLNDLELWGLRPTSQAKQTTDCDGRCKIKNMYNLLSHWCFTTNIVWEKCMCVFFCYGSQWNAFSGNYQSLHIDNYWNDLTNFLHFQYTFFDFCIRMIPPRILVKNGKARVQCRIYNLKIISPGK